MCGDTRPGHTEISTAAHDRATSALAELIDHYAGNFPDVVVAQIVVAGEAVDALRDATASAELLVIGRHSGKQREARSLGSVARQLINTARCPTLVAPPIHASTNDWSVSGHFNQRCAAAIVAFERALIDRRAPDNPRAPAVSIRYLHGSLLEH